MNQKESIHFNEGQSNLRILKILMLPTIVIILNWFHSNFERIIKKIGHLVM